jgi:transposase InsO family protein
VKFAFIKAEMVAFPVTALCRLLGVSASGFYASTDRPASARSKRDQELALRLHAFHKASRQRYGAPRLHEDLRGAGERVSRKRVSRLLREEGLKARTRRKFRCTTDSKHSFPIADNLLGRNFTSEAANKAWVTDITFLHTAQGWLYLAVVLDLFSRRVVGWAADENIDRHLALAALKMATGKRRPDAGLIHHSDRGSTYAANDYRAALKADGITCSMSRKGDCWDNAVAESFFATLKREMDDADNLQTRAMGVERISSYIEWYNTKRRNYSVGYKTPL